MTRSEICFMNRHIHSATLLVFFLHKIALLLTPTAYNSTSGPRVTKNTNRKSYFASQTKPSACYCDALNVREISRVLRSIWRRCSKVTTLWRYTNLVISIIIIIIIICMLPVRDRPPVWVRLSVTSVSLSVCLSVYPCCNRKTA